ncbi:MAG: acyltransferase family protein [Acetatifactor sp.]
MEKGKQERIQYLDTAKGIGILLVCVGHACTNQADVRECPWADIIRFVTLFHMALFFFINGMLYHVRYSVNPLTGIGKKIRAYYVPFVAYNLIFWLFHNLFARLHLISGALDSKDYAYVGIRAYLISLVKTLLGFRQRFAGAMWFLEALLVMSAVFILADYGATRWFPKKQFLVLSLTVAAIALVNRLFHLQEIPHIPASLTQMVYWGLNGLVFFYLGYVYRTWGWNERLLKYKRWLVPCLFAVMLVTVLLMRPRVVSVITNKSIPVYRYGFGALIGGAEDDGLSLLQYGIFSVICLCGILMTLLLSQLKGISESRIMKLFGRYSLHIMCLQFLAFKAVSRLIIAVYDLPMERLAEYPVLRGVDGLWWVAYALAGCVLPVLAVRLCEYVKKGFIRICGRQKA